jgi:peroxiredoxin
VKKTNRLEFPVLSDAGNTYAAGLGLTHVLPDDLREVYRGFGIVLPDVNGDDSWTLPIPTRLIIDKDGVIRNVAADPDYTRRPEPTDVLTALKALG